MQMELSVKQKYPISDIDKRKKIPTPKVFIKHF